MIFINCVFMFDFSSAKYFINDCKHLLLLLLLLFFIPRKNEGGKKLRKVERGLKWKTSPGGPQRENRRAAIRH